MTGASGTVKIRVYEFVGSSQQGSTVYSQVTALTSNWQQLTVDYTVRTQGSYLSIRITDAASSSTESFLVDDVVINQLSPAPWSRAGPRRRSSAPRRVRLTSSRRLRYWIPSIPLDVRLEGLPPEMERRDSLDRPAVRGREIAALPGRIVLGGDRDGNGIEEVSAEFAPAELRGLLADLAGGQDVELTLVATAGEAKALEAPLTLRVEGPAAVFAASFAPNPVRSEATLTFTDHPVRRRARRPLRRQRPRRAAPDGRADARGRTPPARSIDVNSRTPLPAGLYFYRVLAGEGQLKGRFVLTR